MTAKQVHEAKRNRGAQPGNINALKHGRYTKMVPPVEPELQSYMQDSTLEQEISMLRKATRRVTELVDQEVDVDLAIKVLGALGLAAIRTSRLLKSQKELGNGDHAMEIIQAALGDDFKEWGW